jgi:electron transport complex protein RnfC
MKKETLKTKTRTLSESIRSLTASRVMLPLKQEYGAPCQPSVEVGQRVRVGDLVAASAPDSSLQLRVHASISGIVTAITDAIMIECRGGASLPAQNEEDETTLPPLRDETPEAIREVVREAGIIGLGGAGFPTYVKLTLAPNDKVDTVLINAVECEPYLTCDYHVLTEHAEDVVDGLHLIQKAVSAQHGCIVTGTDRREATKNAAALLGSSNGNRVLHVEHEGVLGYEKTLILAALGRVVPFQKLPKDVGVVVQNVQTAVAISQAARQGKPLTSRVITVSGGGITKPGNYRVPIGTPAQTILEACGWQPDRTAAVIMGGPMMGVAIEDLQTPTRKGTGGILALTPDEVRRLSEEPCIRCGACADACPLGLVPAMVDRVNGASAAVLESLYVDYCVECGECEYACPSGRRLLDKMRTAKRVVAEARKTQR